MDAGEYTQRRREALRQGSVLLQATSACAEAVEELLKTSLENEVPFLAAALSSHADDGSASAPEMEVVFESHLHDLGEITSALELAELHIGTLSRH